MQIIRNCICVFGRNVYDTDETTSILEIMLTLHCPVFEETESTFFLMLLIFKSSCSDTYLDVSLIVSCNADSRTKLL